MQEKSVELNKETAMRLWNMSFGKESKAVDFAGRTIAKGAYNDRNSEFGWNVDHILPQSKNGKTADYNLICCHISTNDEKADSFPCFKANDRSFEIVKVQRHYEIRERHSKAQEGQKTVNLYDSAAGVRLFKSLKGIQNKKRFVGTVFVYLKSVSSGAVIDFIEKIFNKENIFYAENSHKIYLEGMAVIPDVKIQITNFDMPEKSDIEELLDRCVLLNTYLSSYFLQSRYISGYDIYFRIDRFEQRADLFSSKPLREPYCFRPLYLMYQNSFFVNELVRINTTVQNKVEMNSGSEYVEYRCVFTKLKENLTKEANGEK